MPPPASGHEGRCANRSRWQPAVPRLNKESRSQSVKVPFASWENSSTPSGGEGCIECKGAPLDVESFWLLRRLTADTYAIRMESTSPNALADLVRRAQKGDEGAQRELIVSYQHRVAGFVYAMTGRSDYVDDLSQQVFIKMIRALDRLQAPAQFESWLFRLARNTCIDHLRRQKLRRIFTPFSAEHENIAEPAGAVDAEELDALQHALQQLPPKDRALLALAQEGRSQVEMAEATGTSVMAVKARLHRARERLREFYQRPHET
jgi:RNA polymerase sigma-70 factor (ECF subfamily)